MSLLHYLFLVFAQKDEQLFFHNFQAFFQLLKFLCFIVHVVVVVAVVVVAELFQFLEIFFFVGCSTTLFFVGVGKTILFYNTILYYTILFF